MSRLLSPAAVTGQSGPDSQACATWPDARNRRSGVVCLRLVCGAPGEIRTPNLLIRSQMLYPLSYGRLS